MATKKQTAANRKNAKKSTGPRTAAGRNVSRANAVTHGVFRSPTITMFETDNELVRLTASLLVEYGPEGAYENSLIRRLAQLLMKERRLDRYEAVERQTDQIHVLRDVLLEETGKDPEFKDLTAADKAHAAILRPMSHIDELLKCGRYQTMLQNQIDKTVRELERVQASRSKTPAKLGGPGED